MNGYLDTSATISQATLAVGNLPSSYTGGAGYKVIAPTSPTRRATDRSARWSGASGPVGVVLVTEVSNGDGTPTYVYRSATPTTSGTAREYFRLRLTLR